MDLTAPEASASEEDHFEFGKNWNRFLSTLDENRIESAVQSLRSLLGRDSLEGMRFLDAGSGSGLFSLAARRLGADVTSIDVDAFSVGCTEHLKQRFHPNDPLWQVVRGSILDGKFLESLGEFDIVYSWGVVHHTGDMWKAIDNLIPRVKAGRMLVLAIYNDQLYVSRFWRGVKRIYQRLPTIIRPLYVALFGVESFLVRLFMTMLACLLRVLTLRNPLIPIQNWIGEFRQRGMHGWYDLVDWIGGWPFEVAKPEDVFRYLRDRGFRLAEMTTSGGHGCNEFAFVRDR